MEAEKISQPRGVVVVVLSKFSDIFADFFANLQEFVGEEFRKIVVRDGQEVKILYSTMAEAPVGWEIVQGPDNFSMAGNANLGWKAAAPYDVLYCGDDVRFTAAGSVEKLREMAYLDPAVGILSPRIDGGANNVLQMAPGDVDLAYAEKLCFPCVYIKRAVIERIGYLDESLTPTPDSYGFDDDDMCRRARQAGFKLAVTGRVTVTHPQQAMSTFRRNHGGDTRPVQQAMERGRKLYQEKLARQ